MPISVTAISGEFIEDASIRSFGDLSAYVPNFSVTENAVNTIITMRGISVGAQQSFEQSVGVFVDGVHYGKSRQARLGLFDLEQIESSRPPGHPVWKEHPGRCGQRPHGGTEGG